MKKNFLISIALIGILSGIFFYNFFIKNNVSNFIEYNFWQQIVKIVTREGENIKNESTGIFLGDVVLTSYHSVANDNEHIFIDWKKYFKIYFDNWTDIALLSENKNSDGAKNFSKILEKYFTENTSVWDTATVYVWRDGKLINMTGTIIEKNTEKTGMHTNGKLEKIFIKNMTNIVVVPGDSGTPIFDKNNKIIDIVHIAN